MATMTTSWPTGEWTSGRRRRSAKSSTNCLRPTGGVPEGTRLRGRVCGLWSTDCSPAGGASRVLCSVEAFCC